MEHLSILTEDLRNIEDTLQSTISFPNNTQVKLRLSRAIKHVSWADIIVNRLSLTKEDKYNIYSASQKYHYLLHTYLKLKLPTLRVHPNYKDSIEIAWIKNIGLNIIKEAYLLYNRELTIQKIDRTWLNIHKHYYISPDRLSLYNYLLGNRPELLNWSSELPETILTIPQQWNYSSHPSLAIPLFYCTTANLLHRYKFRLNVRKLVRMRKKTEQGWVEIPPNLEYLDIPQKQDYLLNDPEMRGIYALVDKSELDYLSKNPYHYYTTDIVNISNKEVINAGNTIQLIPFTDRLPCRAIFWVAERTEDKKLNRYVYSTNGINPFVSAKLLYGSIERFPELDNHYDLIDLWFNHKHANMEEVGFNCMSFAIQPTTNEFDSGVVFPINARLVLRLRDNSKDNSKDNSNTNNDSSRYIINAYCLVSKEVVLSRDVC